MAGLQSQVDYIQDLGSSLIAEAPEGANTGAIDQQLDAVLTWYDTLNQDIAENLLTMEQGSEVVSAFQNNLRATGAHFAELDEELEGMAAVGRDLDVLQSQLEDIKAFIGSMDEERAALEEMERQCKELIDDGYISDPEPFIKQVKMHFGISSLCPAKHFRIITTHTTVPCCKRNMF